MTEIEILVSLRNFLLEGELYKYLCHHLSDLNVDRSFLEKCGLRDLWIKEGHKAEIDDDGYYKAWDCIGFFRSNAPNGVTYEELLISEKIRLIDILLEKKQSK